MYILKRGVNITDEIILKIATVLAFILTAVGSVLFLSPSDAFIYPMMFLGMVGFAILAFSVAEMFWENLAHYQFMDKKWFVALLSIGMAVVLGFIVSQVFHYPECWLSCGY